VFVTKSVRWTVIFKQASKTDDNIHKTRVTVIFTGSVRQTVNFIR